MTDYMPRKCLSALPRMPEAERIAELEAQLLSVCQREAQTFARHDARIEALEAEIADLRGRLAAAEGETLVRVFQEGGGFIATHIGPDILTQGSTVADALDRLAALIRVEEEAE